eukprot:s2592_g7.t1
MAQEPGVDLYVQCKRKAMSQALKQLAGSSRSSEIVFVSVGDSQVEAEAATDLAPASNQSPLLGRPVQSQLKACIQHRIIKLQDEPSIEDLTNQLQELQEVLPRVCGVEGDTRFELASARMLTRAPRAQAVPRTERDNETDRDDPLDEGVENYFYSVRKNVFEYDDVMDTQRKIVYGLRRRALLDDDETIRCCLGT